MRKIIKHKVTTFVFITLSLLLFSSSAFATGYCIGDVNNDGKVSIRDATLIQLHLAKVNDYQFTGIALLSADVNEDNDVSILDVTAIQKYKAGIKVSYRINQYIEIEEPTTNPTTSTLDNQWLPGFFD